MAELTLPQGLLYSLVLLMSACFVFCGLYVPDAMKRDKTLTEDQTEDIKDSLALVSVFITLAGILLVFRILTISVGSPNPAGILYSCAVALILMLGSYLFFWGELKPGIYIPI